MGRRPITSQVSRFAMSHAEAEIRRRGAVPEDIEDPRPRGELARLEVGRLAYEINVQQYACEGLNFGTYYDRSPIIAYDGAEHPPFTMNRYTPSTVPGCRTPHLWRGDGSLLYDAMGPEFMLLRFYSAVDVTALECAALRRATPLKILDVEQPDPAIFYGGALVLSRPDPCSLARRSLAERSAGADRSHPRRCELAVRKDRDRMNSLGPPSSLRLLRSIPSRIPADAVRSGP
jgi:hypothetical protein